MLGVTLFGLFLTPVFYVLVRRMVEGKDGVRTIPVHALVAVPEREVTHV
jgi:hypothetical protein